MTRRQTIIDRLSDTWSLAVSCAAALSRPRTDVAAADEAFVALARDSAMARLADAVGQAVRAAWNDSLACSLSRRMARPIVALDREATVRAAGWMMTVASSTALLLGALQSTPAGPFSMVLPAACAAAGLALMAAAGPLARAMARPQS